MTNEQRRRAIGKANAAERRASDGAAARRQIGQSMIERRTGKSQVEQINAVVAPPRTRTSLPPIAPRGGQAGQVGTGTYSAPPSTGGGGIASPLAAQSRTFSDEPVYVETFDGSGLFRVSQVATLTLLDAENNEVLITGLAFEPPTP